MPTQDAKTSAPTLSWTYHGVRYAADVGALLAAGYVPASDLAAAREELERLRADAVTTQAAWVALSRWEQRTNAGSVCIPQALDDGTMRMYAGRPWGSQKCGKGLDAASAALHLCHELGLTLATPPSPAEKPHDGMGGGDEDGYDMTGASGPVTHRDVRGFLLVHSTRIGKMATEQLMLYIDKATTAEARVVDLLRQIADLSQQLGVAQGQAEGHRIQREAADARVIEYKASEAHWREATRELTAQLQAEEDAIGELPRLQELERQVRYARECGWQLSFGTDNALKLLDALRASAPSGEKETGAGLDLEAATLPEPDAPRFATSPFREAAEASAGCKRCGAKIALGQDYQLHGGDKPYCADCYQLLSSGAPPEQAPSLRTCMWQQDDGSDGDPSTPECGAPATHISCVWRGGMPVCVEHKCRCNTPIVKPPEPPGQAEFCPERGLCGSAMCGKWPGSCIHTTCPTCDARPMRPCIRLTESNAPPDLTLANAATVAQASAAAPYECPPGSREHPLYNDGDGTLSMGPGFTTVRACEHCGALVRGGPTACVHCVEAERASAVGDSLDRELAEYTECARLVNESIPDWHPVKQTALRGTELALGILRSLADRLAKGAK